MKVVQSKLSVGTEGKFLIDSTNWKCKSSSKSKNISSIKRKNDDIENYQPTKIFRKDGIYCDSAVVSEPLQDLEEKKENAQEIKDMLTSKDPSPHYWECVAEKRRKALEATLEENRELRKENDFLKGENQVLEEMLVEAKQLAALVQAITNDSEKDEDERTEGHKCGTQDHCDKDSASWEQEPL